jgi:hypothetical protein
MGNTCGRREAVVEKMHEYTGLSADSLKAANLRVSEIAFAHELLNAQRKTVGRLEGRFVGPHRIRWKNTPTMTRSRQRSVSVTGSTGIESVLPTSNSFVRRRYYIRENNEFA